MIDITYVDIPALASTFWILIPFVLFVVINLISPFVNPVGEDITSTVLIDEPFKVALNKPSTDCPLSVSMTSRFGDLVNPLPPSIISTLEIESDPVNSINLGISASGCNVLSDEYSKPSFMTLVFLILPIVFDLGIMIASWVVVVPTPTNDGSFL